MPMPLLFWIIFITVVGACVGSFLNVVTLRLPEGRNIVTPPSACPRCGHKLAWFENVPIVSWLVLRGRCRSCGEPISIQYPIVEAVTAVLFGTVATLWYATDLREPMYLAGIEATWPVLAVHLVLIASLVAATVIDARYYIIPLPIPWVATLVAIIALPLATGLEWQTAIAEVTPALGPSGAAAALGGAIGLGAAYALLRSGLLPRSFDEDEEAGEQSAEPVHPEQFLEHPHPRREVLKESLFVALPTVGAVIGGLAVSGPVLYAPASISPTLAVLGGAVSGYLVGGAVVWLTRILGTLAFGKEAMGLGDVHLLGAIGAVMGAIESVLVFFVAPFLGLVGAAVSAGLAALWKGEVRVIPYGPYLAGAAVVVMVMREPLLELIEPLLEVLGMV